MSFTILENTPMGKINGMNVPKEFHAPIQAAVNAGWTLALGGSGHYLLRGPNGSSVTVSRSPSDWRSKANLVAELKRHGVSMHAAPKRPTTTPINWELRILELMDSGRPDRPWAVVTLAARLGAPEPAILSTVQRLTQRGVLRDCGEKLVEGAVQPVLTWCRTKVAADEPVRKRESLKRGGAPRFDAELQQWLDANPSLTNFTLGDIRRDVWPDAPMEVSRKRVAYACIRGIIARGAVRGHYVRAKANDHGITMPDGVAVLPLVAPASLATVAYTPESGTANGSSPAAATIAAERREQAIVADYIERKGGQHPNPAPAIETEGTPDLRTRYAEMLLRHADQSGELDAGLLDRIEKLL